MNDTSKHRRHISPKHFCLSKTEAEAFGCKSPKTKSPGLHTDLRPVRPFRNQTRRFSVKYKREGHFSFFVLRFICCSSSKLRLHTWPTWKDLAVHLRCHLHYGLSLCTFLPNNTKHTRHHTGNVIIPGSDSAPLQPLSPCTPGTTTDHMLLLWDESYIYFSTHFYICKINDSDWRRFYNNRKNNLCL